VSGAVKSAAGKVKFVRVDTPDANTRVHCAGQAWAGRSEVPLSTLTTEQLKQLKDHEQLKVEELDRDAEPEAA
jgi:hypothetical protein